MQQQTLGDYQSSVDRTNSPGHPLCQLCNDVGLTGDEYRDGDLLHHLYHDHELDQKEMLEFLSCSSRTTLRTWLEKGGVEISPYQYEMPESELRTLYIDEEWTVQELADKYGCSRLAVLNRMDIHGIERRTTSETLRDTDDTRYKDEESLRELYVDDGLSKLEIAERCGVSESTVQYWMTKYGIDARDFSGAQLLRNEKRDMPYQDEYLLYTLYWEHELNTREIADRLGCTQLPITTRMNKYDIPFRYAGAHGSTYETDRGEYVRSTHERQIANWLHSHGLDYEYEPDLDSPMTPDFLVGGVFIEHWGMVNREEYRERMAEKKSLYDELDIDPIYTYPDDLDDLSKKLGCLTD